jgi:hypothetical protein
MYRTLGYVESFDGSNAESVVGFLKEMEHRYGFVVGFGKVVQNQWVQHLSGQARDWYEGWYTGAVGMGCIPTWKNTCRALYGRFGVPVIDALPQGPLESGRAYVLRATQHFQFLGIKDECTLTRLIWAGLHNRYKSLPGYGRTDLASLRHYVRKWDFGNQEVTPNWEDFNGQILQRVKKARNRTRCTWCKTRGSHQTWCGRSGIKRERESDNVGSQRPGSVDQLRHQRNRAARRRCYSCNRYGHLAFQCPTPKRTSATKMGQESVN